MASACTVVTGRVRRPYGHSHLPSSQQRPQRRLSAKNLTCRTPTISIIPDEILFKIFEDLQFEDTQSCRLVCRNWKELFRDNYFWLRYLKANYGKGWGRHPEQGILDEWLNDGYTVETSFLPIAPRHVFSEHRRPRRLENGLIVPHDFRLPTKNRRLLAQETSSSYFHFVVSLNICLKLHGAIHENGFVYSGSCDFAWNSSCHSLMDIFLIPWTDEELPSPRQIGHKMGINPRLYASAIASSKSARFSIDDLSQIFSYHWKENGIVSPFHTWASRQLCPYAQYRQVCFDVRDPTHSRCASPVLIYFKLAPGWLGGLLTSLW